MRCFLPETKRLVSQTSDNAYRMVVLRLLNHSLNIANFKMFRTKTSPTN